jgi:hypothetical protein
MNEPLHPSSLGEILDRTAQLYRSRFLVFLGISLIPTGVVVALACVVGLVVAWWSAAGAGSVARETGFALVGLFGIGVALVALPAYLAVTALAAAAMNHAVSRVHFGESTTIRDAYKSGWRRGWRYIGLYLLEALLVWAAPAAVWFALVFLSAMGVALAKGALGTAADLFVGLIFFLSFVAVIGYAIWMLIEFSLAFPICVVEEMRAWASLKRSFFLCKGTRGRIFLLGLLVAVLGSLLSMGLALLLIILVSLIPGIGSPQHVQALGVATILIMYGSGFAVQALLRPVYGIALVLFYYDQRIRLEGYDIEWMMQQAGLAPPPGTTAQVPVAVPEAGREPLPWLPVASRLTPAPEDKADSPKTGVEE